MITLADYWMGRDVKFKSDLTTQIQQNAAVVVDKANQLLSRFGETRRVTSGWRPPAVNASTPNAAPLSKHTQGLAIDISDPEGDLDEWCLSNPDVLGELGLWQEHPSATKGWCHVQTVPPKSGKRVFYP